MKLFDIARCMAVPSFIELGLSADKLGRRSDTFMAISPYTLEEASAFTLEYICLLAFLYLYLFLLGI